MLHLIVMFLDFGSTTHFNYNRYFPSCSCWWCAKPRLRFHANFKTQYNSPQHLDVPGTDQYKAIEPNQPATGLSIHLNVSIRLFERVCETLYRCEYNWIRPIRETVWKHTEESAVRPCYEEPTGVRAILFHRY